MRGTRERTVAVEDPDVLQPRRLWRTLWDGRKWKGEADSKRVDITSALVGLVVSAGIIGLWLPLGLNNAAVDRDNVQRCWEAAMEIRRNVYVLQDGFIIQPSTPVPRRADLRAVQLALDNAKFACSHVPGQSDRQARLDELLGNSESLIIRSDAGDFRNGDDFEATGFVSDVRRWTDDSLKQLAR